MFLWGALKPSDIVRAAHALADIAAERRVAGAEREALPADRPMAKARTEHERLSPTEAAATAQRETAQNQNLS